MTHAPVRRGRWRRNPPPAAPAPQRTPKPSSTTAAATSAATSAPTVGAGGSTMITGISRSRAAVSYASVAAPPLFLVTSADTAYRAISAVSSSRVNGPRSSTTVCRLGSTVPGGSMLRIR